MMQKLLAALAAASILILVGGCRRDRSAPTTTVVATPNAALPADLVLRLTSPCQGDLVGAVQQVKLVVSAPVPRPMTTGVLVTTPTGQSWFTPARSSDTGMTAQVVVGQPGDAGIAFALQAYAGPVLPTDQPINVPVEARLSEPVLVRRTY